MNQALETMTGRQDIVNVPCHHQKIMHLELNLFINLVAHQVIVEKSEEYHHHSIIVIEVDLHLLEFILTIVHHLELFITDFLIKGGQKCIIGVQDGLGVH